MLLLLISLFLNYGLFHCNQVRQANSNITQLSAQMHRSIREIDTLLSEFQKEIRNEKAVLRTVDLEDNLKDVGLLDYSITPMWWEGTFRVDETGRNNPALTFLPTPVGYGMSKSSEYNPQDTTNLWENLNSLPGIQPNSSTGTTDVGPIVHPSFPFPTFPPASTLLSPTSFTPVYPVPVPDEDYLPGSPVSWVDPFKLIRPTRLANDTDITTTSAADTRPWPPSETTTRVSTLSPSPPLSLPVLRGPFTYSPKTSTIFNFFMMSKRMQERTAYTTNKRITNSNRITPMTHQPQQIGSTLSKAQAWVRNRQWMKTSKGGRHKEVLRTTVTAISPPIFDHMEYMEDAETAYTGALFTDDAQGFLYVSLPANTTPVVTSPPTTAGDVLNFAHNFTRPSYAATVPPNQVYHDQMEQRDEGFMVVFLLELSRLVFQKREDYVRDVLHHSHFIMNWYYETGQIAWMGQRIMDLAVKICDFSSASATYDMEILQTYAGMINQMLKERTTAVSDEMNSIIDYADLMYEDDEGEQLFDAVREFEEYPNVTRTSREICFNLMIAFLRPFRRLKTSLRIERLLNAVNNALIKRFDVRRSNGEVLMLGGTATTKPNNSRERKRVHNSLKQRISIKRHIINHTRYHDSNEDAYRRQFIRARNPMLRNIPPITRHQLIMTPRQLRSNAYLKIERPTKDYSYRRLGRPIHPPNGMLQFFPQVTKESVKKRRVQSTQVTQNLKESESQKRERPGRINVELRRNIEDSSYSDEEALLKINLRSSSVR